MKMYIQPVFEKGGTKKLNSPISRFPLSSNETAGGFVMTLVGKRMGQFQALRH